MTRIEYELLRDEHPELRLPWWHQLREEHKDRVKELSKDRLIASRTGVLLGRVWPQTNLEGM